MSWCGGGLRLARGLLSGRTFKEGWYDDKDFVPVEVFSQFAEAANGGKAVSGDDGF